MMELSDCVLYGITPPKIGHTAERYEEIKGIQQQRIHGIQPDALIIYDIQDESSRTNVERPFPFVETVQPEVYASELLVDSSISPIIYKSIGKLNAIEFQDWLVDLKTKHLVLVGSPSSNNLPTLQLGEAYEIARSVRKDLQIGGIVIPERHQLKGDEHLRLLAKMEAGCSYFISQCVYSIESTLNLLSDYQWSCKQNGIKMAPIIFTLTPCASEQTLQFMKWLGINVPKWIIHQLMQSENMLQTSLELCSNLADHLIDFCSIHQIPFGFNIESVSIRKQEIDASVALFHTIQSKMLMNKEKDLVCFERNQPKSFNAI